MGVVGYLQARCTPIVCKKGTERTKMVLYQPILLGQIADIRDYPEIVKFIAKIRKSKEQQKKPICK